MHKSSSYELEARHADVITAAVKSITGQTLRKLATEATRGKSTFLKTPFYKVSVDTRIPGVPEDFVYANSTEIFSKVFKEVEGFGFFKYKHKFTGETTVEITLYFEREIIFK